MIFEQTKRNKTKTAMQAATTKTKIAASRLRFFCCCATLFYLHAD
jgi:hypothetical protein